MAKLKMFQSNMNFLQVMALLMGHNIEIGWNYNLSFSCYPFLSPVSRKITITNTFCLSFMTKKAKLHWQPKLREVRQRRHLLIWKNLTNRWLDVIFKKQRERGKERENGFKMWLTVIRNYWSTVLGRS